MNGFLDSKKVEELRKEYPPGTRIELEHMEDPYTRLVSGDRGTVQYVDDAGQLQMRWDSGSGLALDIHVDTFRKLTERELADEKAESEETDEDEFEM